MRRIVAAVAAAGLVVLVGVALAVRRSDPATHPAPAIDAPPPAAAPGNQPGLLFGRVATVDGATFEGRLRFGGTQEAFWSDTFNGARRENPWAGLVPPERLPRESDPIVLFGITLTRRERPIDLRRHFMVRFGDLVRLESRGRDVVATLKSGTVVELDRFEASDFDDGVRVWDARRGVVDLDSVRIRSIDFLPTPDLDAVPARVHGTVHTRAGAFTGCVQWDREDGVQVDDPRYGRVLVSREAFERIDFTPGDGGPGYGDFPPGRPLEGSVTTRRGDRLAGRLVFDLDESETVETLDATSGAVDYTLPFGLVASIVLPEGGGPARVTLHGGEEIELERAGDLGPRNAGLLVFPEGSGHPEYVPWGEVARVDLTAPGGGGPTGLR